jgi:hypothetical protein
MLIKEAQQEVRTVFLGGSVGQAVSGILWLVSAALGYWVSPKAGIYFLIFGGMLIFPLTQLALKILGQQASLRKENPLNNLAMQIAFTVPLLIPLILVATMYNINWFYPAFMLVVGAHYLPFIFLYGMWQYGVLAALLIGGSLTIAMNLADIFTLGGWVTGSVLILFAVIIRFIAKRENRAE